MDENWPERLAAAVRTARKVAVLGVGNPGRGDDGAGPSCADLLKKKLARRSAKRVFVLNGYDVPETQTGPLRKFAPDLTVIVDAAYGGRTPGAIFIVDGDKIADEGVSTHRLSLHYLVRYLQESLASRVVVVGIEPEATEDGAPFSPDVERAVAVLVDFLSAALASPPRSRA